MGGSFFIFHNESSLTAIKPLVIMFYFSEKMKADDKIFFFPEDINLREEIRNIPVMYYITSENEDKTDDAGTDSDGIYNNQQNCNETDWNLIKPSAIYYIYFTGTNSEKEEKQRDNNPEKKIEAYLKPQWKKVFQNKQLLRITDISESSGDEDKEKTDRKIQIYIYKIELNR